MARVLLVDILSVLFGLGTWVCVNGLWVELPLFVQVLPEAWNLPSYLAVVIQVANLAPLAYSILNSFFPNVITEKRTIYFTILIGSISTFLVSLFWKRTSYLWGDTRSTALLCLVLFMAMVDCSSRILYLPFMSRFNEMYLMSFFIGEGLSALVPSILALIQGVGGNPECRLVNQTIENTTDYVQKYEAYTPPPRFSVEVFFYFLFGIVITSAIAFHVLNYNSIVEKALASESSSKIPDKIAQAHYSKSESLLNSPETTHVAFYHSTTPSNSIETPNQVNAAEIANTNSHVKDNNNLDQGTSTRSDYYDTNFNSESDSSTRDGNLPRALVVYVLVIQLIACMFSNGVLPSVQSYSCLPYGNVAYHLAATLSTITNPGVCFLLLVIPKPTKNSITVVFSLALLVSIYVLTTAIQSPEPPFVGQFIGEFLMVTSWVFLVGLFTYVKVSVATILRSDGKRGLFWCGAITQCGSAIGALVTFFIVNFTTVFQSYYACQSENAIPTTISSIS